MAAAVSDLEVYNDTIRRYLRWQKIKAVAAAQIVNVIAAPAVNSTNQSCTELGREFSAGSLFIVAER